jgi:hypothetical protein
MFDLEQSIANWRRQMQAAGIQPPSKLDELEGHLREDFQLHMKAGLDQARALEHAIATIGHADTLRAEFDRATHAGPLSMMVRVLALIWLAGCVFSFNTVLRQAFFPGGGFQVTPILFFSLSAQFIYLAGALGGVVLFLGARAGIYILRTVALLFVIACAAQALNPGLGFGWRMWCVAFGGFSLTTIYLLRKFLAANPKPLQLRKTYV